MSQVQAQPCYTPAEYLAIERSAPYKSEYVNGTIVAMSGASRRHTRIAFNLAGELRPQLKGKPCTAHISDMRVKVNATGLYTYPDVIIVCGDEQFEDDAVDVLLNPTVIIEVLSPSTEHYDRGAKFAHYRRLESLMEYVLVSQEGVHIEHYARQSDDRWLLSEVHRLEDVLALPTVGCRIALAEIYDQTHIRDTAEP